MDYLSWVAPAVGAAALLVAFGLANWVGKQPAGNERMREIAGFIQEGSMAFLKREYKTMVFVVIALVIILGFGIDWITAILFVFGALFSVLAGYFGMSVATKGNVRTANA
ncbi:MAG: sodium-translocating pyrophosphatase, partial [Clostridiales bacterium]|nr:sodium-translocating pyrophosphatase [Clostridiales bacterium]